MMTPITLTAACGAEKEEEEEDVGDNALYKWSLESKPGLEIRQQGGDGTA